MIFMDIFLTKNPSETENRLLFFMYCFWAFFQICRPQDLFLFLQPLRPALLLFIAVSILFLFKMKSVTHNNIRNDKQCINYIYLLCVIFFSIFFSYYRRNSFNFFMMFYLQTFMFFIYFVYIIDTVRRIETIIIICSFGVGFYSLWSLIQGVAVENRLSFGEMFDANDIAYLILSFIFFNFLIFKVRCPKIIVVIATVNIVSGFLVILKSGSRGGIIAATVALALMLFSKSNLVPKFTRMLIVIGLVLYFLYSGQDFSRYQTLTEVSEDYNVKDETGRVQIWKTGIRLMLTRPFTGVGINCFPEAIGRDREARGVDTRSWQTAHNSFLQIGTETGILGFILFTAMSVRALKIFNYVRKNAVDTRLMMIGEIAFISFTGNLVAALFLSQAYSIIWSFFMALSVVLARLTHQNGTSSPLKFQTVKDLSHFQI
jgi:O-antigen ligase